MEQLENYNPEIELATPVAEDKFDEHMKAARNESMKARRKVFMNQHEANGDRSSRYANIKSSVY